MQTLAVAKPILIYTTTPTSRFDLAVNHRLSILAFGRTRTGLMAQTPFGDLFRQVQLILLFNVSEHLFRIFLLADSCSVQFPI